MLGETEVSLEEHKESFRDKLTRMVDKLVSDVDEFEASFAATAPKSVADAVTHAALDAAARRWRRSTPSPLARAREAEVRKGLGIFGTAPPRLEPIDAWSRRRRSTRALGPHRAVALGVRRLVSRKFRDLRVEEMETTATINKNVVKLGKKVLGDATRAAWSGGRGAL